MKFNNVDLNKLKTFYAVIHWGNYQKAGEELGLTRSAISQSITTLESQLGVLLFQRKGKRLFPTDEARHLWGELRLSKGILENALTQLGQRPEQIKGMVRIGSYFEFAKSKLTLPLREVCERYPQIQVKLLFDSPSRLQSHLEKGRVDMTFSIYPHQSSKDIQSLKVHEQELVLVVPNKWFKSAHDFDELMKLPMIEYYQSHMLLPRWILTHFQRRVRKLPVKIFAASAEMLLELVQLEMGIGVLPLYLWEGLRPEGVRVVRPTEKRMKSHIWMNQFKGQFESSAHKAFFEGLRARLS